MVDFVNVRARGALPEGDGDLFMLAAAALLMISILYLARVCCVQCRRSRQYFIDPHIVTEKRAAHVPCSQ